MNAREWHAASLERASQWLRDDTAVLTGYAKAMLDHDYSPQTDRLICAAETALVEALLAVKLSKAAYQKKASADIGDIVWASERRR